MGVKKKEKGIMQDRHFSWMLYCESREGRYCIEHVDIDEPCSSFNMMVSTNTFDEA
ncbi:hypothetical protein DIRU0_E22892 [Diutina rugosa]